MSARPDLLDLSPSDLDAFVQRLAAAPYRSRQIADWLYRKGETRLDHMTNLGKALRQALRDGARIGGGAEVDVVRSKDGRTAKYLFRFEDSACVEAVSMKEWRRQTVCISSQVGCAMGCRFCATAGMGFVRDLTAGEILLQVATLLREEGAIRNVVFMGMGEPLLNLPRVLRAVDALTDEARFGLGRRRITISTCGIVPGILALAESPNPVRLALSLNAPFDDRRAELMPGARKYPLSDVIGACETFAQKAGQRVTLEYVLFAGVNTDRQSALELARISARLDGKVNLIEYNPAPHAPFASPGPGETQRFRDWLEREGVAVTIRFRRGREIAAGCGQLAGKKSGT